MTENMPASWRHDLIIEINNKCALTPEAIGVGRGIDRSPFRWWRPTNLGFAPVVDDPCDDCEPEFKGKSMIFAKAGEPVTTEGGEVICRVKNDLHRHSIARAADFHEFTEGETPWVDGQTVDPRCVRYNPDSYSLEICINGEWRS